MSEQIPIPTIDQFVQELETVSGWDELGVYLCVPTSELDVVTHHYRFEGTQLLLVKLL